MKKKPLSEKELPQIITPKKSSRKNRQEVADDADMKSFRRKWAIINMILETNEGYTIEELAEHFNVSPRTIRRDIGIFDVVFGGFDAENEKWGKKRFTLERIPFGENSGLTREELIAFCIAQRLMEPLKGTVFGDSMKSGCEKVRGCLKEETIKYADRIASFFYRSEYRCPHNRRTGMIINEILKALLDSYAIKIRYYSVETNEETIEALLPYTFLYHEGFFYLVGYSRKTNDVRIWKMNRIRAVKITDTRFLPPEEFDLQKYLAGNLVPAISELEPIKVKIRFVPSVATYVEELKLPEFEKKVRTEDGSLDAVMKVCPDEAFLHWVLSFGATAEVLEPSSIRQSIAEEVKVIRGRYTYVG